MSARLRPALPKYRPSCCKTNFTRNLSKKSAIENKNSSVNAIVYEATEATPHSSDAPLSDVSVAIKDNICTADMPTTCSSKMLGQFTSPFTATVVDLLIEHGAIIVGKTNCDEFGMGCVIPLSRAMTTGTNFLA